MRFLLTVWTWSAAPVRRSLGFILRMGHVAPAAAADADPAVMEHVTQVS